MTERRKYQGRILLVSGRERGFLVAIEFCLVLYHGGNSCVATRVFLVAIKPSSSMSRHGSPCVTTYQDRLLLAFGVVTEEWSR